MSQPRNALHTNWSLAAILGVLAFILFKPMLPEFEGDLFPVVVDANITAVESTGDMHTDIRGETTKVRACEWIKTEVWAGEPGRSMLLSVTRPDGLTNFGLGRSAWSPMRLPLPQQLTTRATAVVEHRCHALWNTETRLFGPETPRP